MNNKYTSLAVTILLSLTVMAGCSKNEPPQVTTNQTPTATAEAEKGKLPILQSTGKPMASLTLPAFNSKDNKEIGLRPNKGQNLTILTAWSPAWFDDSPAQIEALKEIRKNYPAESLRIICLVYDSPQDTVKKCITEQNITFEIAQGTPQVYEKLPIESIPTYWFLDSDGNTLEIYEALLNAEDLDAKINGLVRDFSQSE
ncbi:redoxin domain-containing protein [bacterium]|nr:redoxin domain-containing protein [bacterium]